MLKKIFAKIINAAMLIGTKNLNKLSEKSPLLVKLAGIFILAGRDVVNALLDGNKDNAGQLKTILKVHTNSIIREGAELAREKVLGFNDIKLANAVVVYLNGAEHLLRILVDDNPDNEGQAKAILSEYKDKVLGPTVDIATDKLGEILKDKISDPAIAQMLVDLLQTIDEFVKTDEPTPA